MLSTGAGDAATSLASFLKTRVQPSAHTEANRIKGLLIALCAHLHCKPDRPLRNPEILFAFGTMEACCKTPSGFRAAAASSTLPLGFYAARGRTLLLPLQLAPAKPSVVVQAGMPGPLQQLADILLNRVRHGHKLSRPQND